MTARDCANRETIYMIIYEAKNIINGKRYIGQTVNSLEHRMRQHLNSVTAKTGCTYFKRALKKHGSENFVWAVIDRADTREELDEKESFWINFFDTTNPSKGYNLKGGASKPFMTERVKEAIGKAQIGTLNHMYGKTGADNPTSIPVIDITTGEKFDSASSLCREHPEFDLSKVCAVCRGERMTHKKHTFRYLDEHGNVIENGKPTDAKVIEAVKEKAYNIGVRKIKVMDLTNNIEYDSLFDALGPKRGRSLATKLKRHNGECVFFGIHYKII